MRHRDPQKPDHAGGLRDLEPLHGGAEADLDRPGLPPPDRPSAGRGTVVTSDAHGGLDRAPRRWLALAGGAPSSQRQRQRQRQRRERNEDRNRKQSPPPVSSATP
jgi:hypothetical protein